MGSSLSTRPEPPVLTHRSIPKISIDDDDLASASELEVERDNVTAHHRDTDRKDEVHQDNVCGDEAEGRSSRDSYQYRFDGSAASALHGPLHTLCSEFEAECRRALLFGNNEHDQATIILLQTCQFEIDLTKGFDFPTLDELRLSGEEAEIFRQSLEALMQENQRLREVTSLLEELVTALRKEYELSTRKTEMLVELIQVMTR